MPQKAWSKKRERQYEHIKESVKERGASEEKAEEIAARTVNKERARAGEAKTSSRLSRDRHVVRPPRRAALRDEAAEGPHEGAALQRGQEHGHRGPLEDEQGSSSSARSTAASEATQAVTAATLTRGDGPDH